jgi:hypothetical protein
MRAAKERLPRRVLDAADNPRKFDGQIGIAGACLTPAEC